MDNALSNGIYLHLNTGNSGDKINQRIRKKQKVFPLLSP